MRTLNVMKNWAHHARPLRWLGSAVLAVAVGVSGSGTALAIPRDPIDPPPVGPPEVFEPPANGFVWNVPARFGASADGLVDYHWDESATTFGPGGAYAQAYVNPTGFPVNVDGCQTNADENGSGNIAANAYSWTLPGASSAVPPIHTCQFTVTYPAQGTYTITLDVRAPDGTALPTGRTAPFSQPIVVKDWLIVSIGDSYASGEGDPDISQQFDWLGFVRAGPRWEDKRCHRSAYAGAAQAAMTFENADPRSSVTFISLACSGATIDRSTLRDHLSSQPQGSGVLAGYRGAEPPPGTGYSVAERLPAQIDALARTLNGRRIDALIISGGGNDIGFADIVGVCAANPRCFDSPVPEDFGDPSSNNKFNLAQVASDELSALPFRYDRLAAAINDPAPQGRPPLHVDNVFLTQYPDFGRADDGNFCPGIVNDVIPGFSFTAAELSWAVPNVFQPLDNAMQQAAARHGWHFVGGISAEFAGSAAQPGHGYCASQNWVRRVPESERVEGPLSTIPPIPVPGFEWTAAIIALINYYVNSQNTKGTLHPTIEGHQAYARHILASLQQFLVSPLPPPPAGPPPTLNLSSIGSAHGDNGWLIGRCAPAQACSTDQAVFTVTTTAAGPGIGIQAAGVSVDGTAGCAVASAVCTTQATTATSTSPGAYQWSFNVTADGFHHLQFTVRDSQGQVASVAQEVKVDLHDPTTSAAISSGILGTAGWYRSPVDVTLDGSDPNGGSGVGRIQYQVDGSPLGSAPPGGKVTITADGLHTLSYHAVDLAGRTSAEQTLSLKIDQTPPLISAIQVSGIAPTTATLAWTTDEASTSQVDYGIPSVTTSSPLDSGLVTSHQVTLTGLLGGTTYHAVVKSADAAGNLATSTDLTFSTPPTSVMLNGTSGYLEAPARPTLNITGDWTVEAWFRDEDPNGFNHDFRQILMKGDRNATAEAPYFILVGGNALLAGVRTGGTDYPIQMNLAAAGVDPKAWHHVAVTFRADVNVLNLWLDGKHISYVSVPAHSTTGNNLPLELGRNGATTGKYWLGKLDDVRIWNVARTGVDITASYRGQLTSVPAGLVANWKLDDSSGATAADVAGGNAAALNGGASFSGDVHP